jgi:Calcineurin-like phosphoesterase
MLLNLYENESYLRKMYQIFPPKKNPFNSSTIGLITLVLPVCSILLFNHIQAFSQNYHGEDQQNPFLAIADYNVVAVGDWYCNEETKKTINNILAVEPELIITTGDQVKNEKSAACWIKMSEPIKDKMKIAIGNHDAEFANIYKQIVNYHNLKSPYYSHDFKNMHFISMSTEHPFEVGSTQYEFIKNDLEKSSTNSSIDWIIIHQHKPLYSTLQDKKEAEELRDTYQQLFQHYDVDLVISSHNQYYERTYPILFNENNEKKNDKSDAPQPIIAAQQQSKYPPTNGIIFLTVGTAGDELDSVTENPYFYAVQESKFGFLNIKIQNNGNTLVGEFLTNDGSMLDYFELNNVKGSINQGEEKLQLIEYKN